MFENPCNTFMSGILPTVQPGSEYVYDVEPDKVFYAVSVKDGVITELEEISEINEYVKSKKPFVYIMSKEELYDINLAHKFNVSMVNWTEELDPILTRLDNKLLLPDDDTRSYLVIHSDLTPNIMEQYPVYGIYKRPGDAKTKCCKLAYDATLQELQLSANSRAMLFNNTYENPSIQSRNSNLIPLTQFMMQVLCSMNRDTFDIQMFMFELEKRIPGEMHQVNQIIDSNKLMNLKFDIIIMDGETSKLAKYKHKFANLSKVDGPVEIFDIWARDTTNPALYGYDFTALGKKQAPVAANGGIWNHGEDVYSN